MSNKSGYSGNVIDGEVLSSRFDDDPPSTNRAGNNGKAGFGSSVKHALWSGGTKRKFATLGAAAAAVGAGAYGYNRHKKKSTPT